MKVYREWNDNQALLDEIHGRLDEQLCANMSLSVYSSYERGDYGEQGYLELRADDGRRFRLDLHEII